MKIQYEPMNFNENQKEINENQFRLPNHGYRPQTLNLDSGERAKDDGKQKR